MFVFPFFWPLWMLEIFIIKCWEKSNSNTQIKDYNFYKIQQMIINSGRFVLLNQIKCIQKQGDSIRNPEKRRKFHIVLTNSWLLLLLFTTMSEKKSKRQIEPLFPFSINITKANTSNPWIQVFLKQKRLTYSQYLNGVERTVFGVWTTCRCGVTPEKSLSCKGVLSPPFNGVSTLVRAMRFWASW